jgi:hypothetical protein
MRLFFIWMVRLAPKEGACALYQFDRGRVARVVGKQRERSHWIWVPQVPRFWAPGIAQPLSIRFWFFLDNHSDAL